MNQPEMNGHQHAEAFRHMTYVAKDDPSIWMRVYNARDGVTPFGMMHPRLDVELTHKPPWQLDQYDPFYVPQVGEYVWIDLDPEKAMQIAMERVEQWWNDPKYPLSESGMTKIEAAQMFVKDMLYTTNFETGETIEAHAPDLVQVTEPLQDRIAIEVKERFEKRAPIDWSRTIPAGGGRFA